MAAVERQRRCVRAAAGEGLEHEEQQHRSDGGDQHRADREVVERAAVDGLHERAADQRTEDSDHDGVDAAAALVVHDPAGQEPGQEPGCDPRDDAAHRCDGSNRTGPTVRSPMAWWEALLLVGGGLLAGTINAVAGAGSILTVPLLVLAGVPGNDANGSNRVGILTSNAAAAVSFRRLGVRGLRAALPILVPVVAGAIVGSFTIGAAHRRGLRAVLRVSGLPARDPVAAHAEGARRRQAVEHERDGRGVHRDRSLRRRRAGRASGSCSSPRSTRAGYDLVLANNIKVVVNLSITVAALPFFIARGEVDWIPALVLAAGFTVGGWVGAHAAVRGGERFLRWAMVAAAVLLAGRLLGLYG